VSGVRRVVVSPRASLRLDAAVAWLTERAPDEPLLVLGASLEAAAHIVRRAGRATLGWRTTTLDRFAAELAAPALAQDGLSIASTIATEAICTRVIDDLHRQGRLGRLEPIARTPGLPRAVARTIQEIRHADTDAAHVPDDLRRIVECFEGTLREYGLADRPLVLRLATVAIHSVPPVLLLDVPARTRTEARLLAALANAASHVLATVPAGDDAARTYHEEALGTAAELLSPAQGDALSRLQARLFEGGGTGPTSGESQEVVVLSAPGEDRECVEIARHIHEEAARGIPFDRMAVLLHAPHLYRAPLEVALRRAAVPAWFARGSRAPDPSGRSLLALLYCIEDGFSARRFAEYLSLGEVPQATAQGTPPPPAPRDEVFFPPDDELLAPTPSVEGPELDVANVEHAGTVRSPRRWEELLVEAAVIGGLDRWERRLRGLARELKLQAAAAEQQGENETLGARLARRRDELDNLSDFALPLLAELDRLPRRGATWRDWIDGLARVASRALRHPERVLALLAELEPLSSVGPVTLLEVRGVLARRLGDLAVPPTGRRFGRIFVGDPDSARGLDFDIVFVPGLAERVFPGKVVEDPILSDVARAALPGLETNEQRAQRERAALRMAVGAAMRRAFLSWSRLDAEQGRPRVPSFYGLEVARATKGVLPSFDDFARKADLVGEARLGWPAPEDPKDAIDEAEHDVALLARAATLPKEDAESTGRCLLDGNVHLGRAIRARGRRWMARAFTPADGLVDPRPLGKDALAAHALSMRPYSPTTLEQFATCPYRFLLKAVHRLEPREEPVSIEHMDPLTRGSLVHDVQFELLTALHNEGSLPVRPAALAEVFRRLDAVLDGVAERYRDDLAPAIPRVWRDEVEAIRADLREWLRRAAEERVWTPARFEIAFGLPTRDIKDEASTIDPVTLECGISLRGAIDVVETRLPDRLRVTDHKTGKVRVESGAVVAGGAALQPVLYALAAEKLFPGRVVEAGRLYYCTRAGGFEERVVPLHDGARDAIAEVARTIGAFLDGGHLPAAPAKGACRWCDYLPVCGPHEERRVRRKSVEGIEGLAKLREMP